MSKKIVHTFCLIVDYIVHVDLTAVLTPDALLVMEGAKSPPSIDSNPKVFMGIPTYSS